MKPLDIRYNTVSLRTAECLLLSAIELLQDTYKEDIHEFAALTPDFCLDTDAKKDLLDEIEFLNGLINELKNSRNELKRILPQRRPNNAATD